MKSIFLLQTVCILVLSSAIKVNATTDHSKMDHYSMNHNPARTNDVMPTEAGNDAFGTIQEIITILANDPTTNWEKVNIEALRKHLSDMEDMTLNIEVISQSPVQGGLAVVIKPTTNRSAAVLKRVFSAHPKQLKNETGWMMDVDYSNGQYTLTTTTEDPNEVNKIRGLGYIGLMAPGNHHQPHNLSMARDNNPHSYHSEY